MEGKPVEYNFRFLYHFQGLLPWLVLIGVSLALKENRKAEILWILAPLTMVWLLFVLGKRMMGLPSSAHVELNMMFTGIIGSFIAVFLTAKRIQHRSRLFVFLIPALYLTVIFFSGVIRKDTRPMAAILVVSVLSLCAAYIGAKVACREEFFVSRFLVWKGLCLLISFITILLLVAYVWSLSRHYGFEGMVFEILVGGAICSVIYFVALLPFEVLLFVSPFWRKRFEVVFGLKISEQSDLDQQNRFILDDETFSQLGDKL